MYTIARSLMEATCHYVPCEQHRYMASFNGYPLYQNPAVFKIIRAMYEDNKFIVDINEDTWTAWYPLEKKIDLESVNQRLVKLG